jgi:hypothetical protein
MKRKPQISETDAFALFSLSLMLKEDHSIDPVLHAKLDGANSGMAERLATLTPDELFKLKAAISDAGKQGRMLGPFKAGELFDRLAAVAVRGTTSQGFPTSSPAG